MSKDRGMDIQVQLLRNLEKLEKAAAQHVAMVDRQCTLLDKLLYRLLRR
jgi:hypothetical protein